MAIITVTMKDTDALYDAIQEKVQDELKTSGLPEDEQELLQEARQEKYSDALDKFFEYSEYVTLEFDTEARTGRIVTKAELEKARNE